MLPLEICTLILPSQAESNQSTPSNSEMTSGWTGYSASGLNPGLSVMHWDQPEPPTKMRRPASSVLASPRSTSTALAGLSREPWNLPIRAAVSLGPEMVTGFSGLMTSLER